MYLQGFVRCLYFVEASYMVFVFFFFSSRRRHTRYWRDWSSDVCSSDLEIWHRVRRLLERFDHLVTPCMAVLPFPVEQNYPETIAGEAMKTYVDWIAPTFVLSLTGLPVASVPCGLDREGLPVGLQVVGPQEGEEAVLALASRIQELHPIGLPTVAAAQMK